MNEAFVRTVLAGGPALGRRIRYLAPPEAGPGAEPAAPGPWLEIVGVVEDLQASAMDREYAPSVAYYAVSPAELQSVDLLVRVRGGGPADFAPRLRRVAASLDPDLRLGDVRNLATMRNGRYFAISIAVLPLVLGTVLLLSAAGVHALMSVTVTRRSREIGIRAGLGARTSRLLAGIFSRAAWQLALGGILGALLGTALFLGNGLAGREAAAFLGTVVALMLAAGLLATLGPARRGLAIQPIEALKAE